MDNATTAVEELPTSTERETVVEDGYILDAETGEILGMTDALPVNDESTYAEKLGLVDWALCRRASAHAKADSLAHEMNLLIAGIRERFETQIKEQQRKVEWIDRCYTPLFKEVCRTEIEGTTKKSTKRPWGTLKYIASKGKIEVADPVGAAIELFNEGFQHALRFTIDVDRLYLQPDVETPFTSEFSTQMLNLLPKALHCKEGDGQITNTEIHPGVSVQIMSSLIKEELPEGVTCISKIKPEDPLGNFGVAH